MRTHREPPGSRNTSKSSVATERLIPPQRQSPRKVGSSVPAPSLHPQRVGMLKAGWQGDPSTPSGVTCTPGCHLRPWVPLSDLREDSRGRVLDPAPRTRVKGRGCPHPRGHRWVWGVLGGQLLVLSPLTSSHQFKH